MENERLAGSGALLGAQRRELTGIFVRRGLTLAALGVACDLMPALVLMRLMSSSGTAGDLHLAPPYWIRY